MDPTYFARDVQTLERLLRENHSATVGYTGRFGQSRAVEALALNLLDVAKYVVKNQGVSFNIEDPLVDAALEHAIATNNMEALHLIVTHSSLRPTCLTQDTISQFTVESVEDSFPINRRLSRGNTALHYAVMYESVHATDYLLAQGANPAFVWPELPKKRWAHGIMTLPRAQSYPSKAPSPFQITNSTNEPLVLQYRASNEFHYVQVIAAREVVSLRFAPGTVLQLLHQVTGQVVAYLDSGAYDIVDVIGPGHVVDDTFGRTAADTIAAWSPLQSVMTAVYPPESPMAAIQARLQLKDRMLALLKAPQLFDMRFVVDMVPLVTSVEDLAYFVGIVVAYDTLWSDQAGDDMLSRLLRHVMDKKLVLQSEQAAFFSVYILDRLKNLGRLNEFQVAFWKSEATKVGGESAGWVAELRQRQQVVALNLHHLNDQIGTVAAVVSRMGQTLANLLQREQVRAIRVRQLRAVETMSHILVFQGEFKHKCNVIVGLATCHFGFVGKIAKEGIVRALMYIFKQFVTLPMLRTSGPFTWNALSHMTTSDHLHPGGWHRSTAHAKFLAIDFSVRSEPTAHATCLRITA
ncbi:hypothetical protein, variant 2 [Aphanomyces invadans]|uniref:Uncharacterized protein n=2 Tax=Aphanomyces invadans TaxID=157072 RepID=A0A024TIT5_9STRA|nr:hypothetical protein, variant 2 [Aphanomyces invadans]ETV93267.1 hypothetical protein, variant 2 [Aphanomyces invadans]|eukprot:XP_008878104.1 hypothetical protein, variant 2 [Aphanomyces invadans]